MTREEINEGGYMKALKLLFTLVCVGYYQGEPILVNPAEVAAIRVEKYWDRTVTVIMTRGGEVWTKTPILEVQKRLEAN